MRRQPDHVPLGRAGRSRSSTACTRRSCRSRSSARTARACTRTSRCRRRTATTRSTTPTTSCSCPTTAYGYIAGLLEHVKGITAVANPTVNSYKRLVPGYEAPVYIAWSPGNRSAAIRVPNKRGRSTRAELRTPDPTANPYLAYAVMLAAGLDGMKRGLKPPAPVNKNIYHLDEEESAELDIGRLPHNLSLALDALETDSRAAQGAGRPHRRRVPLGEARRVVGVPGAGAPVGARQVHGDASDAPSRPSAPLGAGRQTRARRSVDRAPGPCSFAGMGLGRLYHG